MSKSFLSSYLGPSVHPFYFDGLFDLIFFLFSPTLSFHFLNAEANSHFIGSFFQDR